MIKKHILLIAFLVMAPVCSLCQDTSPGLPVIWTELDGDPVINLPWKSIFPNSSLSATAQNTVTVSFEDALDTVYVSLDGEATDITNGTFNLTTTGNITVNDIIMANSNITGLHDWNTTNLTYDDDFGELHFIGNAFASFGDSNSFIYHNNTNLHIVDDAAVNIDALLDVSGSVTAGNLTIDSGIITDLSGNISFSDNNLTTTGLGTFADIILTDFDATETIEEILTDTINQGVLDSDGVNDTGGLNISWSGIEIYTPAGDIVAITDGSDTCADSAISHLIWRTGITLQLITTHPLLTDVLVAHMACEDGDILELHNEVLHSTRVRDIQHGLEEFFPVAISPTIGGLAVTNYVDITSDLDVVMSAGEFYHDLHEEHDVSQINSEDTPMVRWYQDGTTAWVNTVNSNIDTAQRNSGSGLENIPNNQYVLSAFKTSTTQIHWIYSDTDYPNSAQALAAVLAGILPDSPPGLDNFPWTSFLIYKQGDTDLTTNATFGILLEHRIDGVMGALPSNDHATLTNLAWSAAGHSGDLDNGSGNITTLGTAFLGLIDLGTNTIDDLAMTGAWDMNSGIITNLNIDSGTIDGITGTSNITDIIISGLTASKGVYTDINKQLTSTPPTSGILGHWTRDDGTDTLNPANANDNLDMGSGNITTTGLGTFDDGIVVNKVEAGLSTWIGADIEVTQTGSFNFDEDLVNMIGAKNQANGEFDLTGSAEGAVFITGMQNFAKWDGTWNAGSYSGLPIEIIGVLNTVFGTQIFDAVPSSSVFEWVGNDTNTAPRFTYNVANTRPITLYGNRMGVTSVIDGSQSSSANITAYGDFVTMPLSSLGTSTAYGIYLDTITADTAWGIYNNASVANVVNNWLGADGSKTYFGTTITDLAIYSDGTNGVIDTDAALLINSTTVDITSTTDPQFRITHTDGVDECDFTVNSDGQLQIDATGFEYYIGDAGDTGSNTLTIFDGGTDNQPGVLTLSTDDGTPYYFWVDTSGNFRGHSAHPSTGDDDTLGVIIADLTP